MVDVGAIAGSVATVVIVVGSHVRTRRTLREDFGEVRTKLDAHLERHGMDDLIEAGELRQEVMALRRRLNSGGGERGTS